MNFFKNSFLILLSVFIFAGCSKEKENACDTNSIVYLNDDAQCSRGRVTSFGKNGTDGEAIAIQFSDAIGKPFITIQTSVRPIGVGNYQRYNSTINDGSNFTRENQTFLKSVVVEITKMDRENKLVSGSFTAEAEAGTYGGVHKLSKFRGTFTDLPLP